MAPVRCWDAGHGGARAATPRAPTPAPLAPPVPFEEDERDPAIWFLDHSYAEAMLAMFRKVNGAREEGEAERARGEGGAADRARKNTAPHHATPRPSTARESVVGWYSTAPSLAPADLDIHALVSNYCPSPILLACRPTPGGAGLPVTAYVTVDGGREDGSRAGSKAFAVARTTVGASEAEEVGVEHLLRDVKDCGARTLGGDVAALAEGLAGLGSRLDAAASYASAVAAGALPPNHDILADLQTAFNELPPPDAPGVGPALGARAADGALAAYVGAATRAVLALHALVNNREAAAAARSGSTAKVGGKEKDDGKDGPATPDKEAAP